MTTPYDHIPIQIKLTDIQPCKELIEECLFAECKHAGEPYAGDGIVECSDDCGACRCRTLAYRIVGGTWEPATTPGDEE